MLKTPVSILQEGLMKSGISLPVYTEVSNKIIGHQQIEFVISVTCGKYKEKGTGTTKKEAKQSAAQAMINLLTPLNLLRSSSSVLQTERKNLQHNLQSSINSSDSSLISLPASSQDMFVNHVGVLMEYCVKHRLPQPCFSVVGASGQDHNLTFTMSCTVGSVCKNASATSKKAAKQNVAKEILQYFKVDTTSNSIYKTCELNEEFKNLQLDEPVQCKEKNQVIQNIYNQFKNESVTSGKQLMVKEYHIALANLYRNTFKSTIPDLKSVYETMEYCTRNITNIKSIIEDSLNVSIKMINIRSQKYDQCIVGLRVTTSPSVVQIGISKTFEQAEKLALEKLLKYIILLKM